MNKLKVVNIISDTNIGGAGKCVITHAKFYDRDRFDLTVVVPRGSKLKPEIDALGVKCIEAEGVADKSLGIKGIFAQRKLFRELGCDVVHAHATLSARIAARLAGVKGIVYTRHSVFEPGRFMKSPVGKVINKIIAALFSDRIIAVAEAAAKNVTDMGVSPKKISVVLNGISPLKPLSDEEKKVQRARFGVKEDEKVVSLVARLETVKGHDDYIKAAQILKEQGVKVKLIAAGNGSREAELKDNKDVLFTGFIRDAYNLIGITDISVNASFGTEATSISLLEGMSLGIPAVVTDYGGNPGVIADGENGFLVPTHSGEKLAEKIKLLAEDEELYRKMSKRATEIFYEKFTAENATRQIEEIYLSVGGKR
ncbi:MAG: glycosyltransferase [Monoglobales bacterium]